MQYIILEIATDIMHYSIGSNRYNVLLLAAIE